MVRKVNKARMAIYGTNDQPTHKRKKSVHAHHEKADAGDRRRTGEIRATDQQSRAEEIKGARTAGSEGLGWPGSAYSRPSPRVSRAPQPRLPDVETPAQRKRRIARERRGF